MRVTASPSPRPRWDGRDWMLLGAATSVAFAIRAIPVLSTSFPLNDGGLFVAMIHALEANHWAVPATVDWNGAAIPFAYPPLGFYVAGLLHVSTGASLEDLLRWIPLAFTTLSVAAVYLLARELLGSRAGAIASALVAAGAPAAFAWPLDGGGVTRAPGIVLALLAIWAGAHVIARPGPRRGLVLGVLGGLTALVHPAAALFAAGSVLLLVVARWRALASVPRQGGTALAVAVGTALLVASPWLAVVTAHGQLSTLVGASSNGPDLGKTLTLLVVGWSTLAGQVDPLALLMLVQAVRLAMRRHFLIPVWWIGASLLSQQYGIVPGALLVGTLALEMVGLATRPQASQRILRGGRAGISLVVVLIGVELVLGGTASLRVGGHLQAISADRRAAMVWVDDTLPQDARVLVLTGGEWSTDADSEWFYDLAGRVSAATVQGTEWLGPDAYHAARATYQMLQECAAEGAGCVASFLRRWPADYIYIPKGRLQGPNSPADCCAVARTGLAEFLGFTLVYDQVGATIFRVDALSLR